MRLANVSIMRCPVLMTPNVELTGAPQTARSAAGGASG